MQCLAPCGAVEEAADGLASVVQTTSAWPLCLVGDLADLSLPREWWRCADDGVDATYAHGAWRLRRWNGAWSVLWCGGDGVRLVLTAPGSVARHPTTVYADEWVRCDSHALTMTMRFDHGDLKRATKGNPIDIAALGIDYFTRRIGELRITRPFWFKLGPHGSARYSGSKGDVPGSRYCPECDQCFSANNFVAQHMKSRVHARAPKSRVCVGIDVEPDAARHFADHVLA